MGKIIRRSIAILLCATAIILILIPSSDASATTIKGDYELDGSILVAYLGTDTEITLPNTITAIGDDAFSKNEALYKVVIPDSVKSIGHAAFEGCVNLTKVSVGQGVKSIGSAAFSGCKNLQSTNIPAKCKDLGSGVYAGCTSLASVSIDPENRFYVCADGVIYTKDGLTLVQYLGGRPSSSYSMPQTVEKIGEYAFWGADSLNTASVSGKVKDIPEYAFSNCASLNKVTLPSSVESLYAFSFADCPSLRKIKIPDSVGYIDEKAFYLTNGATIEFVNATGDTTKTVAVSDVSDDSNDSTASTDDGDDSSSGNGVGYVSPSESHLQNRPDGYTPSYSGNSNWVTIINSRDFADNTASNELGSTMIVGGKAVMIMNPDMPVKGFDIDEAEEEDSLAASGGNTSLRGETFEIIDGVLAVYNGNEENVIIPDNVTKIGERAFYKNENIKNVQIPDSVTEIDDFAFARTNLENVIIPRSVSRIGYAAFYQCPELSNVTIPAETNRIELGAFDGSKWMHDWNESGEGSSYLIVGDGILLAYKGEGGNISIPSETKQIAAGCFDSNENIKGVSIPENVTSIGEDAFNGCTNLSSLTMPEGLKNIEDRAFSNTSLSAVHIPDSVENIGLGAFDTTSNGSTLKTIIFNGSNVPNVTFNDTATRLSARDLRVDALNGVENVIVQANCDLDSGTLFNPRYYGFHGQIYCVAPESNDEQGLLSLIRTTKKPDESGNVNIDSNISIGNLHYMMNGVKEHAFDSYLNYADWCDNKPLAVNVEGNASEELNSLLSSITTNIADSTIPTPGIKVILEGSSLRGEGSASINDINETATLVISENEGNRDLVMSSLYSYYGGQTSVSLLPLEITMFDKSGTLPIHKLGDSKMDVSIPLPDLFAGKDSIKVASLDNDGALTELPTGIDSVNGTDYLNFVANHCSKYAIYSKNETTIIKTDDSLEGELLEDHNNPDSVTPFKDYRHGRNEVDEDSIVQITQISNLDTSEAANTPSDGIIHTLNKSINNRFSVKWFIIVILLALSAILLLYKPNKQKRG